MIKYIVVAALLKVASLSTETTRLYRNLGNKIGAKKREKGRMPRYYFERLCRMLQLDEKYGIFTDCEKVLEIGTGWLHWEAITARLFFDFHGVLYDVWDNRQLSAIKNYLNQLDRMIDGLAITTGRRDRAHRLVKELLRVQTFDNLYELLGFRYIIEPTGRLEKLKDETFDVIVSAAVLEHLRQEEAEKFISKIPALLNPGGYSVHSINITDHIQAYDKSVSPKQYLHYSDRIWKLFFENSVQYINRIQRSEWLGYFEKTGLKLIEEESDLEELGNLRIANMYAKYPVQDLECGVVRFVHRNGL